MPSPGINVIVCDTGSPDYSIHSASPSIRILIIGRMDRAAIDRIVETLLAALEREEECDAASLTFLLRAYRADGRDDVRTALEAALARAIARGAPAGDVEQRAAWLMLFSEATRLSDDERLHAVVTGLVSSLREEWGH